MHSKQKHLLVSLDSVDIIAKSTATDTPNTFLKPDEISVEGDRTFEVVSKEEEQSIAPRWMKSTFAKSVKRFSDNIQNLVWDEHRKPRTRNKQKSDTGIDSTTDKEVSIGKLRIDLVDAYRTDVKDAADGDYFATCAVVDFSGTVVHNGVLLEEDTHTVFNSAAPAFNCKFEFDVPHFRCGVRFILIDGASGRKIGTSYVSIYSLIQVCKLR